MKDKIKFNADKHVLTLIDEWQTWLYAQKRFSAHTLDAYMRDLSFFINFFQNVTIDTLASLDVRDFRRFISHRAALGLEKTSLSREISAFKNFFNWLL